MPGQFEESILRSLRRITRAIDIYSRKLAREFQLTGPQLVCLKQIEKSECITPSELARTISLSQATLTGILDRLEQRGVVVRQRSSQDRRRVNVRLSERGVHLIESVPSPLQERFATRLSNLPFENQLIIDTILSQVVKMMEAEELDAEPVLETGPIEKSGP